MGCELELPREPMVEVEEFDVEGSLPSLGINVLLLSCCCCDCYCLSSVSHGRSNGWQGQWACDMAVMSLDIWTHDKVEYPLS